MELTINGKLSKVELFASAETIQDDFAFKTKGFPYFFNVSGSVLPSGSVTVTSIASKLSKKELPFFLKEHNIAALLKQYPLIPKSKIPLIWLFVKYNRTISDQEKVEFEALELVKYFGKLAAGLNTIDNIIIEYKDYLKQFKRVYEELTQRITKRSEINAILENQPIADSGEFTIDGTSREIIVKPDRKQELVNIFDNLDVSEIIPFACILTLERQVYKIYEFVKQSSKLTSFVKQWIEMLPKTGNHIVLYVVSSPEAKNAPGIQKSKQDAYTKCYIEPTETLDNTFNIRLSLTSKTEQNHELEVSRIQDALMPRTRLSILKNNPTRIKGKYLVRDIVVNPFVWADMIMNDEFVSYFAFYNETQKSVTEKKTFSVYYSTGNTYIKGSPTIGFIFNYNNTIIRLSKVKKQEVIPLIQKIVGKLLNYYKENAKSIVNIYKEIIPKALTRAKQVTEEKVNKKSGLRLLELKEKRPDLFVGNYSSICQLEWHHPYLVDDVDAYKKRVLEFFEKTQGAQIPPKKRWGDGSEFVLNYPKGSNDWYGCIPRNWEDFPLDKLYVYPWVSLNKKEMKQEVPCFPCCFDYESMKKNIGSLKICEKGKEEVYKDTMEYGHLLVSIKRIPAGRYGLLPNLLTLIAKQAKIPDMREGGLVYPSVFRYGVYESPDSFIHAMARACNENYIATDTLQEKIAIVDQIKKDLVDLVQKGMLPSAMQETFGKSKQTLTTTLLENEYIDPKLFCGLLGAYFGVSVYMFGTSKEHPEGKIVIPRYAVTHFWPNEHTQDIVIVSLFYKKLGSGLIYPTQTELIVKFNEKETDLYKRFEAKFENDSELNKVVEKITKNTLISTFM